jgi:O-antigen/teichoic acid export membrane protein
MVLVALWVIFRTFRDLLAETFRGFKDIRMATIFEGLLTSTLSALLFAGLWMLKGQSDLKQVIKLSIIASVATVLIAGLLMWSKIKKIKDEGQLHANEVLAIAWPLWLTNLALFALSQAALWIVGIFCLEKEVAIYGAAARLAVLMTMPLLIVNAVVPPFIAEMYALGKKNELERVLRSIATVVSIPALFISVAFFLFGGSIMGIVYGDYYSKGALVLALLSLGQLINVLAGSCGVTLMMTGHQMTMLLVTIAGGSATIGGAFLLVQRYGIIGVAVAAALAMTLQNILMLLSAKQKTNIWTHADIKRISDMKRMWIISNK